MNQDPPSSTASNNGQEKASVHNIEQIANSPDPALKRDSVLRRMKPWTGKVYDHEPLWRSVTRPFLLIVNPAVAWVVFIQSFSQLWSVVISIILAQAFAPPPYNLNTAQLGYLGVGPLVGGLLASLACHLVSDRMAMAIAKRNGGVFEPEFRLLLIAIAPVFSSLGYFLFGKYAGEGKSPILISFLWGVAFASTQIVCTASGVYLVEAYREIDVDAFVVAMTGKNLVFFGFSCEFLSIHCSDLLISIYLLLIYLTRLHQRLAGQVGYLKCVLLYWRYHARLNPEYYSGVHLWQAVSPVVVLG